MNAEMRALHLAARRATSAKICEAPEDYKVCWVCLSIAFKRAPTCPICRAYRFYESPDALRVVTSLMDRVAFPVTAGTVPRFGAVVRSSPKNGRLKMAINHEALLDALEAAAELTTGITKPSANI
jgi:hypothetical protein